MAAWHDKQSARAEWAEAKNIGDGALDDLLTAAREACWAYYPSPNLEVTEDDMYTGPDEVPVRYRIAQLLQARSVWQLPRAGSDGEVGVEGYSTRLYVLGWDVQRILRPPVFGERVG